MIYLKNISHLLQSNIRSAKTVDIGIFNKPITSTTTVSLEKSPVIEKFEKVMDCSIKDESLAHSLRMDRFGSLKPVFYRIVDENELLKVLSGQAVKSNRACYNGLFTDITTNPFYSKIPRQGKYRLEFNNVENSFANSGRVRAWSPENSHYQIIGPYDKSDIKSIAYFDGDDIIELGSIENFLSKV